MLLIQQAYLVNQIKHSNPSFETLTQLYSVQSKIRKWYSDLSQKIQTQSRKDEFQQSEQTRIYHHELHRKTIKKSAILKLETEKGIIEGHTECAAFLHSTVKKLIGYPAILDIESQNALLDEIEPVYTSADNVKFELTPTNDEILQNLKLSNLNAAPGTDGISGLVYKECWGSLGDSLSEVIIKMFNGADPTVSMRTAIMIFSSKPKKALSIKPSDKRRISILNSDFKLYEGLYAKRFSKIGYRTLSPLQYVTGNNRTI